MFANGVIAPVPVTGWYRSASDFGFTGNASINVNVSGFPMTAMSVNGNANGV